MRKEEISSNDIKKYQDKSIPDLIKIATKYFNRYIRQRDSENGLFKCISCGQLKSDKFMHASHYMSAGNYSATRFNELNVHGACIKCNYYLSGNLIEYRKRLIDKIGLDKVEEIETIARMRHKWDRYALIEIITKYKELCK